MTSRSPPSLAVKKGIETRYFYATLLLSSALAGREKIESLIKKLAVAIVICCKKLRRL